MRVQNHAGDTRRADSQGLITQTGALYIGAGIDTSMLTLHSYKIYIAIRGTFHLHLNDRTTLSFCEAALIAPDRPHRVESQGAVLCVFYLIPETEEGRRISRFFHGQGVASLPAGTATILLPRLRNYLNNGCSVEEAGEVSGELFNVLAPCPGTTTYHDKRVILALEYLNSNLSDRITVADVAATVALSPSRFEHLFRHYVGIPIRRYLLWARVREALKLMANNSPLTQVAQAAGFFDSAHFSRTFRQMIGVAPSMLLRSANLLVGNAETARAESKPEGRAPDANDESISLNDKSRPVALRDSFQPNPVDKRRDDPAE
jgi:AraC family transcriptional regulator